MSQWNNSQYDSSNAGFGGNGGGFNASQSPMVGKTPMTGQKSMAEMSMLPVTVKLLTNAENGPDNSTKVINGRKLTTIKICGRVVSLEAKPTYISYNIDDSTGQMEVRQWTSDDGVSNNEIKEDDFVTVVGRVSIFNGSAQINCYNVFKVKSYNQITHHMISVMFCGESNKKLAALPSAAPTGGMTATNNNMNMAGVSAGNAGDDDGMEDEMKSWDEVQRQVYNAIKAAQGGHENGVYVPDLTGRLGISSDQLRDAMGFLTNEGMIYDTTSDEWVKTTA